VIVVGIALAAVAGAGAWIALRTRHYVATAQVLVTPAPYDDSSYTGLPIVRDTGSDPTRAVQTAAAIFDSPAAAPAAARTLGVSVARVRAAVTVTPVGGSNVLDVQAHADRSADATRIADAFVAAELAERRQLLRVDATGLLAKLKTSPTASTTDVSRVTAVARGFDPSFSSLPAGAPPGVPTERPVWRTLTLVLFAGLVLGVAVALLIDAAAGRRTHAAHPE
jgi:capsular polysaccharide biosynthesis protein